MVDWLREHKNCSTLYAEMLERICLEDKDLGEILTDLHLFPCKDLCDLAGQER